MSKAKIEVGQCYEYRGHIYMVIEVLRKRGNFFVLQETLVKTIHCVPRSFFKHCTRPFQNFG